MFHTNLFLLIIFVCYYLLVPNYIFFGNNDLNLNINDIGYVLINAISEFIGTFILLSLIHIILIYFNLNTKLRKLKNKGLLINALICVGLFVAFLISIGFNVAFFNIFYTNNNCYDVVATTPLLFNPAFSCAYILKGARYLTASFYIPLVNGIIFILFQFFASFLASLLVLKIYYKKMLLSLNFEEITNCFYTRCNMQSKHLGFWLEFFNTFCFALLVMIILTVFNQIQDLVAKNFLRQFLISLALFVILCLTGGVIGNALNPFRDLSPRLACLLLFNKHNFKQRIKQDFSYWWQPFFGSILGCILSVIIAPGFLY